GTVMGTVGYMSPEQVRGMPADGRSDIFSLGCVLYEMAYGARAFQRQTAAETMTAILHDDVPDIPESGRVVPAALNRLIRRCLEKNPSERFQSARDLAFNLRAIADDARGAQEHDLTKPGRLRPMVWAAVILIGLAAVAAGLMWLKPRI